MAIIKAILACDEQWGIGKDGDLPWPRNPADLKWFKESTLNDTVVMGNQRCMGITRWRCSLLKLRGYIRRTNGIKKVQWCERCLDYRWCTIDYWINTHN
jgi:dihydrofolate reductase